MNEDLISKKELLQQYGISYGALYRWKRKGLIPEEWFLRQSTSTGQETYFKRDAICERIGKILAMRDEDNLSLDDMAAVLYPHQEAARQLVVAGKYGTRRFDLNEIQSVSIEDGNGQNAEILWQAIQGKKE